MAAQRFKTAKQLISASVSQEARSLLEQKATVTGSTMSDILDKLIKAAFKPRRGLAKRIAKDKASALANFEIHEQALKAELAALDAEWSNSFQAKLVWMTEQDWSKSTECSLEHLSFWLFSRRVFAIRNKSGQWCSGIDLAKACRSWMNSPLLPDKLLAADLVAETDMSECPEDVYEYLVTTFYDGCEQKAFTEFCCQDTETTVLEAVFEQTGFCDKLSQASQLFSDLGKVIDVRKQCNKNLKPPVSI